jgi:RimJ/RimL family protein N-acetyltransferase
MYPRLPTPSYGSAFLNNRMIKLRKIDQNNWKECIGLEVHDAQKTFVAANVFSLAEVSFYPTYTALAVYNGDTMVGFLLYGKDPDDGRYWIPRLMIDKKYQGNGFGKAAMLELIEILKKKDDCSGIYISHEPENLAAAKLYSSLGFYDTGEKNNGETVKYLDLIPLKTTKPPIINTNRLVIRPFLASDFQDYYEYMSLKETYRFERGEPMTLEEAKKTCREFSGERKFWAVTLKDSGKLIGNVSFTPYRPLEFNTWNLGYIFNPSFQNKGFASEAARAVVVYAFRVMKVHRIVGHCSPDNTPSWKVLEKVGMKKQGMSRKDFPVRTDASGKTVWLDSLEYDMIEEDLA